MEYLMKDSKYEATRKAIIEAFIISRVLCNYIYIMQDDLKNEQVKFFKYLHYIEGGIFYYCKIPTGGKKYYYTKNKQINFFPLVMTEIEKLKDKEKNIPESCIIAKEAYYLYVTILGKRNRYKEEKKRKIRTDTMK